MECDRKLPYEAQCIIGRIIVRGNTGHPSQIILIGDGKDLLGNIDSIFLDGVEIQCSFKSLRFSRSFVYVLVTINLDFNIREIVSCNQAGVILVLSKTYILTILDFSLVLLQCLLGQRTRIRCRQAIPSTTVSALCIHSCYIMQQRSRIIDSQYSVDKLNMIVTLIGITVYNDRMFTQGVIAFTI